jgi:hypothetical protein
VCAQLNGFEAINPYWLDYARDSGWCVKSMRIALWAVYWSEQPVERTVEPLPEWAQGDGGRKYLWILRERGFDAIRMISLIGADSDTYAAIAGPLLAAKFSSQALASPNARQLRKDAAIEIKSTLAQLYALETDEDEGDDDYGCD